MRIRAGRSSTVRGLHATRTGTRLHLGDTAIVEVTGLRNPCAQLDLIQPGLMAATPERDEHGGLIRKAGVMGIVLAGGEVKTGDPVGAVLPARPHRPVEPV
jgi:MOSC domain-containing protein YiiM